MWKNGNEVVCLDVMEYGMLDGLWKMEGESKNGVLGSFWQRSFFLWFKNIKGLYRGMN